MKVANVVMGKWRFVYLATIGAALALGLGLWSPLKAKADKDIKAPAYKVDPFWPKPLPDRWVTGEVAGTCVDSNDHLFTVNRGSTGGPPGNLTAKEALFGQPSPPVIEFDRAGNVVNFWGNLAVLPTGLHGCFVDYQDNVWIAGNGDGIVQKYSHGGTLLMQIGTKGVCDGPCGETASTNSSHTLLNEPADMTVDPSNGDIYIADGYGNHRVVVFNKNGVWLRQWGSAGTGPRQFSPTGGGHPHCVVLDKAGRVYACDRANDRVLVFDKQGVPQRSIPIKPGTGSGTGGTPTGIGSAWDIDFSADKDQTFLFDTDGGNEVLWELDRTAALSGDPNAILVGFGRPGHMAGDFTFLHTVAVDSRNNMFLGETVGGRRVQRFVRVGEARATDTYKGSPHYDPRFPNGENDGNDGNENEP
jgi:hypothetical protein